MYSYCKLFMKVVVVVVLKEVLLGRPHQAHGVQVLQDHQDLLVVVVVGVQQAVVVHSNPSLVEALQDVVGVQVQGVDSPFLGGHDEGQGEDPASDSFVGVDHEVVLHVVHHEDPHEVHYVGHCEDHRDCQDPDDPGDLEARQVDQEEPGPSNWVVAVAVDHFELLEEEVVVVPVVSLVVEHPENYWGLAAAVTAAAVAVAKAFQEGAG